MAIKFLLQETVGGSCAAILGGLIHCCDALKWSGCLKGGRLPYRGGRREHTRDRSLPKELESNRGVATELKTKTSRRRTRINVYKKMMFF